MEEWKRSGQIPAFGNWDLANELPITQYFECARQAGVVRYSSSSGECDACVRGGGDLYAVDYKKGVRNIAPSTLKKTRRNREKQGKVWDVREAPRKEVQKEEGSASSAPQLEVRRPKPVDEDLYKISPELQHTTKRKKMLGFISKCLVAAACFS